jgi:hypothetical protein
MGRRLHALLCVASISLLMLPSGGCLAQQIKTLREDLQDTRAADSRTGVLADELDSASRARLELLGRTSAPTRYAERTDANRIRVVAFDFGGARPGTLADSAGNLMSGSCLFEGKLADWVEVGPFNGPDILTASAPPAGATPTREFNLYKGMFRQYGKQVGTTVEFSAAIGPVGTELTTYFSHNFLVLEWRRYQLTRLKQEANCLLTHVSAIETGVAVRIVFDVRLTTADASLNASFGIADLAAALARSEASVEVSYEVVGTALDLLPRKAVVISSLNEYLDALEKFHEAVVIISDAWQTYASTTDATIKVKMGDGEKPYPRKNLFTPDELAYYVSGSGIGDMYLHISNVEVCEDLKTLKTHYSQQATTSEKDLKELEEKITDLETKRHKKKNSSDRDEARRELNELRPQARALERKLEKEQRRLEVVEFSFVQENCEKSLALEQKRKLYVCAAQAALPAASSAFASALDLAECGDLAPAKLSKEKERIESLVDTQKAGQGDPAQPTDNK